MTIEPSRFTCSLDTFSTKHANIRFFVNVLGTESYTVNGQNLSFFIMFFHHEAHEEHKEIIKSINSNLRTLRGLIFPYNPDRFKKRSL
jgi:hypothetical protein